LSYANSRFRWGNLINCEPSRFIEELDKEHVEETGYRNKNKPNFDFVFDSPGERWNSKSGLPKERATFAQTPSHLKKINSADVKNFVADDTSSLQVGMQVEHQSFGVGKVLLVEDNNSKALIFFEGIGQKQLLLKFAKLKILN
jgi:DNA helicase-2/ATP-dependent DNA helicase PcrA